MEQKTLFFGYNKDSFMGTNFIENFETTVPNLSSVEKKQ